jgi:hypothetical protein
MTLLHSPFLSLLVILENDSKVAKVDSDRITESFTTAITQFALSVRENFSLICIQALLLTVSFLGAKDCSSEQKRPTRF